MTWNVCLDWDGVLCDFSGHYWATYQSWFNVQVNKADRTNWDSPYTSVHFEDRQATRDWLAAVPDFWETIPPIKGALGGVYTLLTQGHRLVIATNRRRATAEAGKRWLERYWPGELPEVYYVEGRSKSIADAQVFVDDSPHVLKDLRGREFKTVRFLQPWNADVEANWKVSNWPQLVKLLSLEDRDGFNPNERTGWPQPGPRRIGLPSQMVPDGVPGDGF